MRLPRMTTRRWMIAVAVVALILWMAGLLSLSARYRDRASHYEFELIGTTPILLGPRERHRIVDPPSAHLLWAREMANKYGRASWCPGSPSSPTHRSREQIARFRVSAGRAQERTSMRLDLLDLVFRLERLFGVRMIRAGAGSPVYDSAFDPPAVLEKKGGTRHRKTLGATGPPVRDSGGISISNSRQ